MGCKAFTPHLVGLARELEGQPFHLIASYNQRGDAKVALHEIFQNGLPLTTGNVSATMRARHPGVTGTGYVPYYMVFDHHGDLVHHHQGGPYHGGDGTKVLGRIREMLRAVPRVYVGKETYANHADLAKKISNGKKLDKSLAQLAEKVAESPDDAELKRLVAAVERHGRRVLREFEREVASDAKRALKKLRASAKSYEGTPWGKELVQRAAQLESKEAGKAHAASSKQLSKALSLWSKATTIKGNDGGVRNPTDPRFREANQPLLDKMIQIIEEVVEAHGELPAGRRAKELLAVLKA